MTTEEKIDQIHMAVMGLQANVAADRTICAARHTAVDERIHGLHRVIKGNGSKGLEQKHNDLHEAFMVFNAKVTAYAAMGSFIGGGLITVIWEYLSK